MDKLHVDGLYVTISDGPVGCYALLNSNVTITCTYEGSSTQPLTGAFWDIRPASGASRFTVPALQPIPGFTVRSDFTAKQSSLTMSINQVSQNASQLQCFFIFAGGALVVGGSYMIQVLFGSMVKEDLPVSF